MLGMALRKQMKFRMRSAKEAMRPERIFIRLKWKASTIPHEVYVEWDGAKILFKPAPEGAGIVAGSKVRSILELGGVKDVIAKSLGSSNPLNLVQATFKALLRLKNREQCLAERKGA